MKRDGKLIRKVLLSISEGKTRNATVEKIEDYTPAVVKEYIRFLYSEGMVEGKVYNTMDNNPDDITVIGLTAFGRKYLASLK